MPSPPTLPDDRRTRLRRVVRRTVLARRRPLAALCAGAAVLAGIHAVRPPDPPTVAVAVAAHDLPSGTVLVPRDLVVRHLPAAVAPAGSDPHPIGRTLAAPVRRGEPVTDVRLVAPSLVAALPGQVALPVRIADADAVGLLRVGDHVDLVAADPRRGTASYVAVDVPVLALPEPPIPGGATTRDTGTTALTGRLVVVAASSSDVTRIAGAAATDLLSLVISR
jgi:Flp pilus assembly protein CpaB